MNNLKYTFLIFAVSCVLPLCAYAQVVVTEIMYDPAGSDSGHEWIEVFNTGTSSIALSEWRVFEGGTNHKIKTATQDGLLLPNAYAVIATKVSQFRADYPGYGGGLFTAAFSLNNGGDSFTLRDAKLKDIAVVNYVSALGGAGDGNSLQRVPDETAAFAPHTPSPGLPMSTEVVPPKVVVLSSPAIKKASKTTVGKTTHVGEAAPDTSAIPEQQPAAAATEVAAADSAPSTTKDSGGYLWLFGVVGAAAIVALAVVASRHAKKHEWDIVEESPEDV